MPPYKFNSMAFLFSVGVDDIEMAYTSSIRSFEQKLLDYDRENAELSQNIKLGLVILGKDDVFSDAEIIDYHREKALDAMRLIRATFLVVIYHYWERCVQDWMRLPRNDRRSFKLEAAFDWIEGRGQHPAREQLEALRNLVNLIKHGTENERCPVPAYLFKDGAGRNHDDLELTADHVSEFFLSVRMSGLKIEVNDWQPIVTASADNQTQTEAVSCCR